MTISSVKEIIEKRFQITMPDYENLTDKYKIYEAGISAGAIKTKKEIKNFRKKLLK